MHRTREKVECCTPGDVSWRQTLTDCSGTQIFFQWLEWSGHVMVCGTSPIPVMILTVSFLTVSFDCRPRHRDVLPVAGVEWPCHGARHQRPRAARPALQVGISILEALFQGTVTLFCN